MKDLVPNTDLLASFLPCSTVYKRSSGAVSGSSAFNMSEVITLRVPCNSSAIDVKESIHFDRHWIYLNDTWSSPDVASTYDHQITC